MNKKTIIILIFLLFLVLLLAPWLNDKKLHDRILEQKGRIDGTIDKNGDLLCDYKVGWWPFGRYVASCEGGYDIFFWNKIAY